MKSSTDNGDRKRSDFFIDADDDTLSIGVLRSRFVSRSSGLGWEFLNQRFDLSLDRSL